MAKGLLPFVILFCVFALAVGSLDLPDSDAPGLGETKSSFYLSIRSYGGGGNYEDEYDNSEYDDDEDDEDYNGDIRDTRDNYYDRTRYEEENRNRYSRCNVCYQYCVSRGTTDYNCDGNMCYCNEAQQTSTTRSTYGPQRMPGDSCHAYSVAIVGHGMETTCDALCRTVGRGKLVGVCIYNQCTCEVMQQNDYSNGYSGYQQNDYSNGYSGYQQNDYSNGYSGYQQNDYSNGYSGYEQYNRQYRSAELSNNTVNVV